jgi:hypothetical protein
MGEYGAAFFSHRRKYAAWTAPVICANAASRGLSLAGTIGWEIMPGERGVSVADLGHISCVGLYMKSIDGLHMIFSGGRVDAAGMGKAGELFLPNGLAHLIWPRPN